MGIPIVGSLGCGGLQKVNAIASMKKCRRAVFCCSASALSLPAWGITAPASTMCPLRKWRVYGHPDPAQASQSLAPSTPKSPNGERHSHYQVPPTERAADSQAHQLTNSRPPRETVGFASIVPQPAGRSFERLFQPERAAASSDACSRKPPQRWVGESAHPFFDCGGR